MSESVKTKDVNPESINTEPLSTEATNTEPVNAEQIITEQKTSNPWYKKRWTATLFISLGLIVIASLLYYSQQASQSNTQVEQQSNTTKDNTSQSDETKDEATDTTNSTTDEQSAENDFLQEEANNSVPQFENEYISMDILDGWTAQEATETLQDQRYDAETDTIINVGDPTTVKTGAINISKNNYILYISPNASQASGVEGGRFSEISSGASGADLVIKSQPADPCGEKQETPLENDIVVSDFYISNSNNTSIETCNTLSSSKNVWYFSYASNDGYFGDVLKINPSIAGDMRQFVITMTYNTDDINKLPEKGSAALLQNLTEMRQMVDTIVFKK